MIYLQRLGPKKTERGDAVRAVKLPGRRVTLWRPLFASLSGAKVVGQFQAECPINFSLSLKVDKPKLVRHQTEPLRAARDYQRGFTLIELVITITVLTILTMGVVPLMKLSVKRQKEQRLHDVLRQMRTAIDEFHRDTVGMPVTAIGGGPPPVAYIDPRSKVVISDPTIFGVDNPDRYPPTLELLVEGVNVIPRAPQVPNPNVPPTQVGQLSTKKKVYLRSIPIDPMTGEADWDFRSCYDAVDSGSWGGENVFDVRSKSKETALNGEKYSDW